MQAGIESALWIVAAALSGNNLVHDVGYIESGLTCSYEMIVMGDEIISFVRRMLGGISMEPEALALDVIDRVGPGGNYMGDPHTARHFRKVWYPRLLDRRGHHAWTEAGEPTAVKTANQVAREILATHTPKPLPAETLAGLRAIIDRADVRAGLTPPPSA
jgi:trimethylamine--corrinoid protein Co-methyltransferase